MKQKNQPLPGTQAVGRALSLLKTFTEDHPRLALYELAARHGLSKPTVHRLLAALEREGFVEKDEATETYGLGPGVMELAGRMMRSSSLHTASQSELRSLATRAGETASLEVLAGYDVLILDEVPAERLMTGTPWIGTRWPAFATSTGRAILALLPEERSAVLRRPLKRFTPRTITDPAALEREFEMVIRHGFAVAEEQLELGFIALGAAVRGRNGEPVAAISIGGPTLRITAERIPHLGTMVRTAAARVSQRLGYSQPG